MSRFSTASNFCILFLAFCWSNYSISAALTLETKVQQLADNYAQFKEFTETENTRLQAQLKTQNEIIKDLTTRCTKLEARVNQLDGDSIEKQNSNFVYGLDSQLLPKSTVITRTCKEARSSDPSLSSGMYWIDPDGQGVGDDPIYVYCNMTSGSTAVPHDSEMAMDVGHCPDPGCYSKAVNYNASNRQILALAELSSECHQYIKYDCYYAPLQFDRVDYAWWNDKNGESNYFWSGSNISVHTCQCGIENNCADPTLNCNCDATVPIQLRDEGLITDKNILPITRLNFGRTQLISSSGVHTLGRFECSGQVAATDMPTSCQDLWRIGHSLSGLYAVKGMNMVETVYCNFSKPFNDPSIQTWIGYADIKSAEISFYVQRSSVFNTTGVITYTTSRLNAGGAMSTSTGKFTAPKNGTYFFSFSGLIYFPGSTSRLVCDVRLYKNTVDIGDARSDEISSVMEHEMLSLQSTLNLIKGEQVWVQITGMSTGVYLMGNYFNHFTGWLLEEDIF